MALTVTHGAKCVVIFRWFGSAESHDQGLKECHIFVNSCLLALKRRLTRQIAKTKGCYD